MPTSLREAVKSPVESQMGWRRWSAFDVYTGPFGLFSFLCHRGSLHTPTKRPVSRRDQRRRRAWEALPRLRRSFRARSPG